MNLNRLVLEEYQGMTSPVEKRMMQQAIDNVKQRENAVINKCYEIIEKCSEMILVYDHEQDKQNFRNLIEACANIIFEANELKTQATKLQGL